MPRTRYLKPDFFTDEDLADLPVHARLLFAGLWCLADRDGRLEDRPRYIKAMIFPYENIDIEKQLLGLSLPKKSNGNPFIIRYKIEGHPVSLIQIVNWEKHQKPHHTEKESSLPHPPENGFPTPLPLKEKTNINGDFNFKGERSECDVKDPLNNGEKMQKEKKQNNIMELFDQFWNEYPKKRNKGDAEKAWLKIRPTSALLQQMLRKLFIAKESDDWIKNGGQYIPYPASWLNAKGWEDEIDRPGVKRLSPEDMWLLAKEEQDRLEEIKNGEERQRTFQITHEPIEGKPSWPKS